MEADARLLSDEEIEPNISAWERLVHPEDRSRADRANDSVARGERATYEAEFRLRHKDGHYVHVLSRGFPVRREPGGPVVRIVGTHLDLTERRQAEAALRENEERLKLAFAGAQEGVWDWNLETGTVVYSSRWKEMLGYADDEIEPHVSAWERLLHPDDMERARRLNESVTSAASTPTKGSSACVTRMVITCTSSRAAIRFAETPGGPVVRIVGTHFDLTERKRAEAERARTEFLTRLVFAQEDERRRIAREMHDQFGEQLTALARRHPSCSRTRAATTTTGARTSSRSKPLRSGSTATSISWCGSSGRPRSTISACARRSPTTSRTGRIASASRPRCTRRDSRRSIARRRRNRALSDRPGGADQRREARQAPRSSK